jgi:hypothetical protein
VDHDITRLFQLAKCRDQQLMEADYQRCLLILTVGLLGDLNLQIGRGFVGRDGTDSPEPGFAARDVRGGHLAALTGLFHQGISNAAG